MIFSLFTSILLLSFVQYGQCAKVATVTLYADNSSSFGGFLTISQYNSTSPVKIDGIIFGINTTVSAAYVCLLRAEIIIRMVVCFSRVFMCILTLSQNLIQTVTHPEDTLIHTVSN